MNGVNETNKSNEMITADRIEAVKQEGRSLVRECIKERSRFSRVFETKNGEKAAVIYPKAVHFKRMMHGKQSTIHLCFLKISSHMRMHRAE